MEVVISDDNDNLAKRWARQFVAANPKQRANLNLASAGKAGSTYEKAASMARNNNMMIVSVGHGGADHTDGTFLLDLAPKKSARLDPDIMDNKHLAKTTQMFKRAREIGVERCKPLVRRFKAVRQATPDKLGPVMPTNEMTDAMACHRFKNNDEHKRVEVRELYSRIGSAIRRHRVGFVVLLTCNVGNSPAFVQRLANDWGTSILAFKDKVALWQDGSGKVRIYLESDAEGTGTNTERARTELPVLLDDLTPMVPSREFDEPVSNDPYIFDSGDRYLICSGRPAGVSI